MMKDPICGMEISEEKAIHMIITGQETCCFCSKQCKESYKRQLGINNPAAKKGFLGRFLERLAKENEKNYGGKPPTCH